MLPPLRAGGGWVNPFGSCMEEKNKEVIAMKNREHGWLVAVFIKGCNGVAYETFCKEEIEAIKEKEIAYRYNSDVENVTIDEVWYNIDTGGYVPA